MTNIAMAYPVTANRQDGGALCLVGRNTAAAGLLQHPLLHKAYLILGKGTACNTEFKLTDYAYSDGNRRINEYICRFWLTDYRNINRAGIEERTLFHACFQTRVSRLTICLLIEFYEILGVKRLFRNADFSFPTDREK